VQLQTTQIQESDRSLFEKAQPHFNDIKPSFEMPVGVVSMDRAERWATEISELPGSEDVAGSKSTYG
jgi:hypothetical protein